MVRRNMTGPKLRRVKKALILAVLGTGIGPADAATEWITHVEAPDRRPVVLHFRRELDLRQVPGSLPVEQPASALIFIRKMRRQR